MNSSTPMSQREQQFEAMLSAVLSQYAETVEKLDKLKAEGKEKTATYRQLFGNKLTLGNIIALYKLYDLID